jgi:exosortase/archaeosortase family protein
MMLFVAVCTAVAFCMRRSTLEKLIVLASAIPIAILANVARIVATSILYEVAGQAWGDRLFHDMAGWFMMPLAVVLLWIELELMSRIVIQSPTGPLAPRTAKLATANAE